LTPGVIDSTNPSSKRVAPLEHVVHPEGHVAQRNASQRVAPLEHVVHPEGHVAQRKKTRSPLEHVVHPEGHVAQREANEASGTLGARSAS
jgi:hypothetical protein